ncbi:recombinase zinc beta ribbon domain-containing protein [Paenibacillus ehimensis]|uniref:recombinase zinc beta ribbon domain-containing protein n=1 Tax=Paenibacillus ehimensis TaxID=79264 RepID=UPI002DB9C7B2|nr:recombinase zinc beta ribbon domain-containing protein [Paenibacillus ehimensis]MEC0210262.1 recombinase zinc beta ribbon domain-containing protein [Paenibacillus ehimensis]
MSTLTSQRFMHILTLVKFFFIKETHMYQFTSKIMCMHCGSKYRGKKMRDKLAYSCSTYEKKGKESCSNNFKIKEEDLVHMVTTHLQIRNVRVEGLLGEHVAKIEVKDEGYRIYYNDGTDSIVNDKSNQYGVKFKY